MGQVAREVVLSSWCMVWQGGRLQEFIVTTPLGDLASKTPNKWSTLQMIRSHMWERKKVHARGAPKSPCVVSSQSCEPLTWGRCRMWSLESRHEEKWARWGSALGSEAGSAGSEVRLPMQRTVLIESFGFLGYL